LISLTDAETPCLPVYMPKGMQAGVQHDCYSLFSLLSKAESNLFFAIS